MDSTQQQSLQNGVYAAVLTPLLPDYTCNHTQLAAHCLELLNQGCQGIALFGTTGEGASFSVQERIEALQRLMQNGIPAEKIILGNGSAGIADTIDLCHQALESGCTSLLIAPPSFYKNISDEGVLAFYRQVLHTIAEPALQILLYHIPQLSGVAISLPVIEVLRKEFPKNIIGIKESEGNLPFTKAILKKFPDFKVFVGNERHILEAVHSGGAGTICGIANAYPQLISSLYEQAKKAFPNLTAENTTFLDTFCKALDGLPFIPAIKALMQSRYGDVWELVRPPLTPLDQHTKKDLLSKLKNKLPF